MAYTMRSMIFTKNSTKLQKQFNVIIAERFDYINNMLSKFELNENCDNYIHPKVSLSFKPFELHLFSGLLLIMTIVFILSIFTFLIEISICRLYSHTKEEKVKHRLKMRIQIVQSVNVKDYHEFMILFNNIARKLEK
jgi:hypothetical protein